MLPTTTTGTGSRADASRPTRYSVLRSAVNARNSSDSGHSAQASAPRRSQARVSVDSREEVWFGMRWRAEPVRARRLLLAARLGREGQLVVAGDARRFEHID